MNEDSAIKHSLGHLIRKKSDLKCVDVETAGTQDTKTQNYIEANMVFQGADLHSHHFTCQTYIHIISGEKDKPILLLGTDVTDPEKDRGGSGKGWTRREAKAEKANGLFRSMDTEGNNMYITHTFPSQQVALAVAKTLARQYKLQFPCI
jgi:hypothetical protein